MNAAGDCEASDKHERGGVFRIRGVGGSPSNY